MTTKKHMKKPAAAAKAAKAPSKVQPLKAKVEAKAGAAAGAGAKAGGGAKASAGFSIGTK